ncbi:hypothetical protein [Microvirga massiliensis]|uniref:hypothetical protein n=1 Tax=Microvirga massiliensis TaxID=1033741 RepID=UPI00062BCB32|nr:hypothetical protein [Microvirga massiliensis]
MRKRSKERVVDHQRAQEIIRRAMIKALHECADPNDPAAFIVIVSACLSSVVAASISAEYVRDPARREQVVSSITAQMADMLRLELDRRLQAELARSTH